MPDESLTIDLKDFQAALRTLSLIDESRFGVVEVTLLEETATLARVLGTGERAEESVDAYGHWPVGVSIAWIQLLPYRDEMLTGDPIVVRLSNDRLWIGDLEGKGVGTTDFTWLWMELPFETGLLSEPGDILDQPLDELAFPEGKEVLRSHLARERNRELVQEAKSRALHMRGTLACEVCGFDFEERYGILGRGFVEVHHAVPLSEGPGPRLTKVSDVILLCSNCHRMAHRYRPWLLASDLRRHLITGA